MEQICFQNQKRICYSFLQRVGTEGPYQNRALLIFFIIALLGSSTFFVNPYLFYQQPYKCIKSTNCQQMVCSLPFEQRQTYRTSCEIITLANYNGDNHCQNMSNVTVLEQSLLLGASVGLLLGILFADFCGKKLTIVFSMIIMVLGLIIIVIVDSMTVKCLGLILWGAGAEISFSLLFAYVTQIVSEKNRSFCFLILQFAFACGTLANTILFYVLKNWVFVIIFYYMLFSIICICAVVFFLESPPLEIVSRSKSPDAALAIFQKIAQTNQKDKFDLTLAEISNVYFQYHQNQNAKNQGMYFTVLDIFRFDSVRFNFIKVCFIFSCLMFSLYAPALLISRLFQNIFLNGLINAASQFVTIPFLFYANSSLSRRKGLTMMFLLTTLFSLFQFLINPKDCLDCITGFSFVLLLVFFFIARFSINLASNFFTNTLNETFAAQIRGICIFLIVGISRLATLTIPYLPKLKEATNLSLNLWFSFVGAAGVLISWRIKQTLGLLPPQMIEELDFEVQNKQ